MDGVTIEAWDFAVGPDGIPLGGVRCFCNRCVIWRKRAIEMVAYAYVNRLWPLKGKN